MAQQSTTGFGVANPVAYSPTEQDEKKVETKDEQKEYESLEEALLGET